MKFTLQLSQVEATAHTCKRIGQSVTQCGRFIFVLGGIPHLNGFQQVESAMLDIVEQEWHRLEEDICANYHTACLVDDKIISIGGLNPYSNSFEDTFAESFTTVFDVVQHSVVVRQDPVRQQSISAPSNCCRHIAEFFESKREIVIFGGRGEDGVFLDQLYGLSVDSMQWRSLRSKGGSPGVQSSHVSCQLEDMMFVFCNYNDATLSDLFLFDYSGSFPHWSALKKLGIPPPGLFGGAMNLVGNRIVLLGGYLNGFSTNELYVYELNRECWSYGYYGEYNPEKAQDGFTIHVEGFIPRLIGRHRGVYSNGKIRYYGGSNALDDVLELDLSSSATAV